MSEVDTTKGDRSAQVAHILHGVRQAEPGELACEQCGTFLCVVCNKGDICETCQDDYDQNYGPDYDEQYDYWVSSKERIDEEEEERHREKTSDHRHK